MQKATITFSDGANGELHLSMQFDPEITDDCRSNAVAYALKCIDYITGALQSPKPKRFVLVDFSSCPECGDDAEILTNGDGKIFKDGDEARCCECHHPGNFAGDSETPGYIDWHDAE